MDIRYPATLKPEENGFFVEFIDLPDTFTEGATEEEALFNAAEVLTAMLDWRLDNDQPIPQASSGLEGVHYIISRCKNPGGAPGAEGAR